MRKLLPLFLMLLFAGTLFAQQYQDYKWLHEKPQGNTLRWVKMWTPTEWYAVGYSGTFMKTTDAGATWWFHHKAGVPRTDGSTSYLYDAHFFNKDTGIVVGTAGVMRTTNGGTSFDTVQVNVPSGATCYQVYFLNNLVGYVAGTSSVRIGRTTDGGLTWTPNLVVTSATYYDVWSPNDTIIVAATSTGNVRRSTDGGTTWATISTGASATLYKLQFEDALKGWVSGSSGAARYTTDAGATWTNANTGLPASTFYDIDIVPEAPVFFESFEGLTFPPAGWQKISVLGALEWVRSTVQFIDGGASAFINYQSTGGEDWLITPRISITAGKQLSFFVQKQYGTAYPPDSLIIMFSSTDSLPASFAAVLSIDVANLPAGWNQYMIPLDSYAGQSIFVAFKHKDTDGNGMWLDKVTVEPVTPANEIWLTGDSFNLYKSADNGTTWTAVSFLSPTQPWTSTHYASDFLGNQFVVVGAFGLTEVKSGSADPVALTTFLKGGIVYDIWANQEKIITVGAPTATGVQDQIMVSTNGGSTWSFPTLTDKQNTSPVDVPVPEESENPDKNIEQLLTPASTATFRSLQMLTTTTGFAVGSNGAIYKTTNGGLQWDSLVTPIPSTAVLYKVDFVSPNVGWVFNNTTDAVGTIWKTTDGGTTWTQQTLTGQTSSATRIYGADMVNENYGWCVNYTPRPFKTTDGGATWALQPLSDAFGGFLYDIQMIDTLLGYCVGSSGRFYKTTDGGTNWNVMPTAYSGATHYDVDFFNANDGVIAGSLGVMQYTTDGGMTWQLDNTTGASTNYCASIKYPVTELDTASLLVGGSSGFVFKKAVHMIPVELTSFTAAVNGSSVTLSWSTATEANNLGFEIERSADGNWSKAGFVKGSGTTSELSEYTFTDRNLTDGKYNYRLKQIDFDGTFKYYNLPEAVEISIPLEFALSQNYPNPFNPVTTIRYSVAKPVVVTLKVYDILGNEVSALVSGMKEAGRYEVQFDGSKYSSGVYFYEINAGDFTAVKKLMLMK